MQDDSTRARPMNAARAPARRGFTLIELMIVVAIIGLLGAIAYPAFMGQVRKSRRADAIKALAQVQQAQERYRAGNASYGDMTTLGLTSATLVPSGYYTINITGNSASGYTATATAAGAQSSDSACTALSVSLTGGNITYDRTGSGSVRTCWNQ